MSYNYYRVTTSPTATIEYRPGVASTNEAESLSVRMREGGLGARGGSLP